MVYAVESFAVVYGNCSCALRRSSLIEALGYGGCERKECCDGGVRLFEAVLSGVGG